MRTPKFGATTRKLADSADKSKKGWHECPKCGKRKLVHGKNYARWICRSCGNEIAGGAYAPQTEVGQIAYRLSKVYEKGGS